MIQLKINKMISHTVEEIVILKPRLHNSYLLIKQINPKKVIRKVNNKRIKYKVSILNINSQIFQLALKYNLVYHSRKN